MKQMTANHRRGYSRDMRVLGHLELCKCLTTEQLYLLEFSDVSAEMTYRCINRLNEGKRIRIGKRVSFAQSKFYWPYDGERPKHIEHTIGVGWIYTFQQIRAKANGYEIYSVELEPDYYEPIVRPDAFIVVKTPTGSQLFFCEFQREENRSKFKKIGQYNELAQKIRKEKANGIQSYWWIDLAKDQTFTVLLVTNGERTKLMQKLDAEPYKYKTEIISLDDLRIFCKRYANS